MAEVSCCKCANDFIVPCHRWNGSAPLRLAHRPRSHFPSYPGLAGRSARLDGRFSLQALPPGGMASVPRPLHFHVIQYEGATLFERISIYSDLTHIKFVYEDESSEEYSVAWEDDDNNEDRNRLQKATITEDGNLCVEIRRR